ncbi:uncharacterized protein LOC128181112 isoform X2 [Crassostrea angulata]|uniref:uncharacterized protein LOC128181112 isoform X2 n=1 Tax=Magallana angulata TaxID=2784310 RepID=UPI0022B0F482|nr:uncharacterized protein LOC128181112 isoform X2 [Crassostrea angulata]
MFLKSYLFALLFSLARSSSEFYGKYLSGFTFASLDKMGKQMCVKECQSYPGRCKSANYNRVHLSCDLNTDSATDKPEAILDREGSTYIEILTSVNSSVCGDIQCSSRKKCVVTKSGPSCIFQDKEEDGWILIYRGQSGGTDSDYLSFISNGTSDETNENVNDEYCTSITKSPLCTTNYRTSLIDRWQSLGNFKVNVSLYKNGTKVAEVVFNGTGTSQESWFSPSKILSSSWSDVTPNQTYNYFSLEGDVDAGQWRNFQIWKSYGGCPNDIFWMSSSYAEPGKLCPREQTSTKQYFYCPETTQCKFDQGAHQVADVMTVSIKMT